MLSNNNSFIFSTLVSDTKIYRLAQILASDTMAVEKRNQIHGQLGLELASLNARRRRCHQDVDSYWFFVDTLSEFRSKTSNASVGDVVECLKELQLESAAGKLVV
jgi:hypothetical protein